MEKKAQKNERGGRIARAQRIIDNWDEILKIADETPSVAEIEAIMKNAGMPTRPEEIGVSKKDAIDAFICSRDIRDKYLLSSMIWDIGYMDEFAKWLEDNI
jgi:glycerol-1-phosphate dehydrogenase [NAD(P)+]